MANTAHSFTYLTLTLGPQSAHYYYYYFTNLWLSTESQGGERGLREHLMALGAFQPSQFGKGLLLTSCGWRPGMLPMFPGKYDLAGK